ncbi:transmembrane amino acid transporter protein [Pelomyxa schiedti]|nr:transmembrane amino acid transporter protein [Pelomyxa schiedti]
MFSAVANFSNTILGAGMLGIPFAFAQLGLIPGIILLVVFGGLSLSGLHLLSCCGNKNEQHMQEGSTLSEVNYYSVAFMVHRRLPIVVDLAVAIKCLGVLISYLIIASDLLPAIIANIWSDSPSFLQDYRFWQPVVWAFAMAPLSFLKKIDSLKYASVGALISVLYLVALTTTIFFMKSVEGDPIELFTLSIKAVAVIPIFVFAYTCHQNLFTIFSELGYDRYRRVNIAILTSITFAGAMYITIGSMGYSTIGPGVKSNVINSYPTDMPAVTVARVFIVFLVTLSYPLLLHPSRKCFDSLFFSSKPATWWPRLRHLIITVALLMTSFLIAFFFRKLDVVLGLVGATGGTLICFILPGSFYFRLHPLPRFHFRRIMAFLLALFGVIMALVCVTTILVNEFFFKRQPTPTNSTSLSSFSAT